MSDSISKKNVKKNEFLGLEANIQLYVEEKEAIAKLIQCCQNDAFVHIVKLINELSHERLMKKLSE